MIFWCTEDLRIVDMSSEPESLHDSLCDKVEKHCEMHDLARPIIVARTLLPRSMLMVLIGLFGFNYAEASCGNWVKGTPGASCDEACAATSKICDPVCQDQTHTVDQLNAAMAAAGGGGPTCPTWRSGTGSICPTISLDDCFYSTSDISTCAAYTAYYSRLCACTATTDVPTETPTASPTETPSELPSTQPTTLPSVVPSTEPTTLPTVIPSTEPTIIPSALPSALPTVKPSAPTAAPATNQANGEKKEKVKATKEPKAPRTSKAPKAPKEKASKAPKVSKQARKDKQPKDKHPKRV